MNIKKDIPLEYNFEIKSEGKTRFYLPLQPKNETKRDISGKKIPNKSMPVFYNHKMTLNRDLTLLMAKIYSNSIGRKISFLDSMAASGVRSIRLLNEMDILKENGLFINDLNPLAIRVIKKSMELNEINQSNYQVFNEDALLFLSRFRYLNNENTQKENKKGNYSDIIDIDPFGSPSKYIPVSFQSIEIGGILCLTATDTPALFGIWKESCIRKYLTRPIKCEFFKEMGTRILIYYVAKMAHLYEMHITPLLSISSDHFIRIFLMINRGIEGGNKNMKNFGKYLYCPNCGFRNFEKFDIKGSKYEDKICSHCNNDRILRSGLVWIGKLHSEFYRNKLVEEVEKASPKNFPSKNKMKKFLELSAREDENFPPYFYSIPKIADSINKTYPSMKKFQEKLNEIGFDVCRTHFDPQGLKTNADIRVIKEIITSFNK